MAEKPNSLIARLTRRNRRGRAEMPEVAESQPQPSGTTASDATEPRPDPMKRPNVTNEVQESHRTDASTHLSNVPGHSRDAAAHRKDGSASQRAKRRRRRPAPARDLTLSHPRLRRVLSSTVYPWSGPNGYSELEDDIVNEAVETMLETGQYVIDGAMTRDGQSVTLTDALIDMYLTRTQVAERINVQPATLSRYELPAPDVLLGTGVTARRGWRVSTILAWRANRPSALGR